MSEDRWAADGGAHKPALSILIRVRGAMPAFARPSSASRKPYCPIRRHL